MNLTLSEFNNMSLAPMLQMWDQPTVQKSDMDQSDDEGIQQVAPSLRQASHQQNGQAKLRIWQEQVRLHGREAADRYMRDAAQNEVQKQFQLQLANKVKEESALKAQEEAQAAQKKKKEEALEKEYAILLAKETKATESAQQVLPAKVVDIVLSYFIPEKQANNDTVYEVALWMEQQSKGPYIQFPGYPSIDISPKLNHELFLRIVKAKVSALGPYPVLTLLQRNVQSSLILYSIKIFKESVNIINLIPTEPAKTPDKSPLKCSYVAAQHCNSVALKLILAEGTLYTDTAQWMLGEMKPLHNLSGAKQAIQLILKNIHSDSFETIANYLIKHNLESLRLFLESNLLIDNGLSGGEHLQKAQMKKNALIVSCYQYYRSKPLEEFQACLKVLFDCGAKISKFLIGDRGQLCYENNGHYETTINNIPTFLEIYRVAFKAGKEKNEDLLCHLAEFVYKTNSLNDEMIQLFQEIIFECNTLHTIKNLRTSFLKKICDSNEVINAAFTERKKANLRNIGNSEGKEAKATGKRKEHPTSESDSDGEVQKPKRKRARGRKGTKPVAAQPKAKPKSKS